MEEDPKLNSTIIEIPNQSYCPNQSFTQSENKENKNIHANTIIASDPRRTLDRPVSGGVISIHFRSKHKKEA